MLLPRIAGERQDDTNPAFFRKILKGRTLCFLEKIQARLRAGDWASQIIAFHKCGLFINREMAPAGQHSVGYA
jgi:hypothetical protein